jgi:hypothetical protein
MEAIIGRKLKRSELVDHEDRNPLNNRRSNLRLCTALQNAHNSGKRKPGTSHYKNVYWDAARNKWSAYINYDGSRMMIGRYDDEVEAAYMFDQWALALQGEYAVFNVIDK